MAEVAVSARAAPLLAAMIAGCGSQPANVSANVAVPPAPRAELSPVERAYASVRMIFDRRPVTFSDTQVFAAGGADVVCGRYRVGEAPPRRFIAVGEEEAFVEDNFAGDMDQAVRETCRNG